MAITGYRLKPDSTRFTLGSRGERKRRAVWLVLGGDRTDGADDAVSSLGLSPGDTYSDGRETDGNVVCTDITVSRTDTEEGVVFEAEANFTSHPNKKPEENNDDPGNTDPFDRPPDIRWGEESHQIPLERGYYVTEAGAVDEAMSPVRNSAGGPFSKTVYIPVFRQTYTVTRNESSFPRSTSRSYAWTCNNASWMDDEAGTWLCKPITGTWVFERIGGAPVGYWRVTYQFVFDERGWDTWLLDEGQQFRENVGGTYQLKKALDERGIPVGFVPLDGSGGKLAEATVVAGEFKYRRYRPKAWTDFDALNVV